LPHVAFSDDLLFVEAVIHFSQYSP
jgi:hypothetical protein